MIFMAIPRDRLRSTVMNFWPAVAKHPPTEIIPFCSTTWA